MQSADDVVAELRRWLPRGGMPVATIKKSWPNCMPALEELERSKRIYVIRTEGSTDRSGQPKTVFLNQTGKTQPIDEGASASVLPSLTMQRSSDHLSTARHPTILSSSRSSKRVRQTLSVPL